MWSRSLAAVIVVAGTLSLSMAACGDDDSGADASASATRSTAASAPVQSPTPTPDRATEALFGVWRTTISEGDNVRLDLRDGSYAIYRGPAAGTGDMEATADEAEFSGSDLCEGAGRYKWSVDGEQLTFTSIGTDACSGRSEVLDGKTYTRQ